MSEQIRRIWSDFDALFAAAETPEAKAQLQAVKLQTELINAGLAAIQAQLGILVARHE